MKPTNKYKHCNHHHELTKDQEFCNFRTGTFVADKKMVPLLRALNEIGLITRTHNHDKETGNCFVGIILAPDLDLEVRTIKEERDSTRKLFDGRQEILLKWNTKEK